MDFQRFGIDPRLWNASEGLKARSYFHEKMLSHVLEKRENVCSRLILSEGREEVYLLPVFQALVSAPAGESAKALVVASDAEGARAAMIAANNLGKEVGLGACLFLEGDGAASGDPVQEGDAAAALVIGVPEALVAASERGVIRLRDYRWLVADGLERLAELSGELLRKLQGLLLPSWERRSLLVCRKLTLKAKNLAWDWADNPSEIHIEEDVVKAQSVPHASWHVPVDSKFKFLLSLIGREQSQRLCVFCNLRSTAEEVARRLEANGRQCDYILGALALDRKNAILERVSSGELPILVLTDEGAQGLASGSFSLLINYDIPLEPELYVKRLEMIDRGSPSAKLLNIVCDRYIYGLTAVEQYIDAKLDALPAEPSQYDVEDRSEGMSFSPPRHPSEQRHGEGRGPWPGRAEEERARGPRNDASAGHDRRGRNGNGRPRDDRSPDIRRSIAEATGGSMEFAEPPARPPRGSSEQRPQQGKHEGRRTPRGDRGRRPAEVRDGSRPRGEARGPGNPYDLSMEERMRRYREKYCNKLDGSPSERQRQPSAGGRRNQGGRGAQRRDEGGLGAPRRSSPDPRLREEGRKTAGTERSRSARPSVPPEADAGRGARREASGSEPPERRGFLDRLQGLLRKHED